KAKGLLRELPPRGQFLSVVRRQQRKFAERLVGLIPLVFEIGVKPMQIRAALFRLPSSGCRHLPQSAASQVSWIAEDYARRAAGQKLFDDADAFGPRRSASL